MYKHKNIIIYKIGSLQDLSKELKNSKKLMFGLKGMEKLLIVYIFYIKNNVNTLFTCQCACVFHLSWCSFEGIRFSISLVPIIL